MMQASMVEWQDDEAGLRVVRANGRVVVEVADGRDAEGQRRWREAHLSAARGREPVYEGWAQIKRALGLRSLNAVLAYARRPVDPLPVRRRFDGRPWIYQAALRAWVESNASRAESLVVERRSAATPPGGRRPRRAP